LADIVSASECVLFNAKRGNFHLYHDKNMLHFEEMVMTMSALY